MELESPPTAISMITVVSMISMRVRPLEPDHLCR